ncbi:MAG: response regulator transcription factor, partial [Candidatus Bathyarchaeia archaeon]
MASVLVISNDPTTCSLVVNCLTTDGHVVATCDTPSAAPRLFATLVFDAVCLDTALDQSSIDDFLRWFQADEQRAAIPILFLLPLGSQWTPAAAPPQLRPGLDGYLVKPLDDDQLRRTMAELLARSPRGLAVYPHILRLPPLTLDRDTRDLSADGGTVHLTPTEDRLTSYLMERPGAVVTRDELLERVWGFHPGTGSAPVVRVHVGNLRRKMAQIGAG